MKHSEKIDEIAKALAKAQGAMGNVIRDLVAKVESTKGSYSYSYADLGACLEVIREPLSANGLSLVQPAETQDGDCVVRTILFHESGQWLDFGELRMTPQRPGPQAMGSCITYCRRYALTSALGIAQTDDDGQEAEGNATHKDAVKPSMHAAIARIDACKSYEDFKDQWKNTDKAIRDEIAKRKPKLIQNWKDKFNADQRQEREEKLEADEDGATPATDGGSDS